MPENIKREHPSYGMLGFHRVSGGDPHLFGSSIEHNNKIQLTLKTAAVERNLSTDWYYGRRTLFAVEMSQTQFADLISSMNVGDGVPVTIRDMNGERMPPVPFESKAEQHRQEFRQTLENTYADTQELISQLSELFSTKKALNKKEQENILQKLNHISQNLQSNQEYQLNLFHEQMEKTVSEAKGEVEAFVMNKMLMLAQQQVVEQFPEGIKAPAGLPELISKAGE